MSVDTGAGEAVGAAVKLSVTVEIDGEAGVSIWMLTKTTLIEGPIRPMVIASGGGTNQNQA